MQSLHSEVHASKEELKGEIRAARDEAKRDNIDLKASVVKRFQSDERRITNIDHLLAKTERSIVLRAVQS